MAISLDAVIGYAEAYGALARETAAALPADDPERANMEAAAACLEAAPRGPARTFREALQAIYIVHCALHWTVEIVPIGRLDKLLIDLYRADLAAGRLTEAEAQELIDCFWIKLDERVILNFRHAENRFTAADGVMTGYGARPISTRAGCSTSGCSRSRSAASSRTRMPRARIPATK